MADFALPLPALPLADAMEILAARLDASSDAELRATIASTTSTGRYRMARAYAAHVLDVRGRANMITRAPRSFARVEG